MARVVRAIQPQVVKDPASGVLLTVNPSHAYAADSALVRAYPWLFAADNDEAPVERGTRAPGERRATRRRGKAKDEAPVEQPAEATDEAPETEQPGEE